MDLREAATEDVAKAARAGDQGAREELFRRLRVSFVALAKQRVMDPDVAEDLAHDALAVVAEKMGQVPADVPLLPWCLTVLRHVVGNFYAARRRLDRLGTWVGSLAVRWHGGANQDARDAREELADAMARLSPRCQQLVEWVLAGVSAEEMQRRLALPSRNALYMRLFRCREELKALLEGER